LPPRLVTERIWDERFEDIRAFERYLHRNGVLVRKFFLHVSKKEQKKRFLARIDDPDKNGSSRSPTWRSGRTSTTTWRRTQQAIRHTATADAPWFVVPADSKWFTRLVVAAAVVEALASLEPHLSGGGGRRSERSFRRRGRASRG